MSKENDKLLAQLLQYHSTLPEEQFLHELTVELEKQTKRKNKLISYALLAASLLAVPFLFTLNVDAFSSAEFLVTCSSLLLFALLNWHLGCQRRVLEVT